MPRALCNCCLCGAPIEETQSWPDWISRFRAVCTLDERWESAFVSGVGERHQGNDLVPNPLRNDGNEIVIPEDGVSLGLEPSDSNEEEMMEIDIRSNRFGGNRFGGNLFGDNLAVGARQRLWGFPFHYSCWELLNARRETHDAARNDPQALFDILRSFPRHRLVEFGHDYGGVAGYDIDEDPFGILDPSHQPSPILPGEERRLVYYRTDTALLEMQTHDPMHVTEICSVFESENFNVRPVSETQPVEDQHDDATIRYNDPFQKLPVELLQSILSELPSAEVVSLKRSSRVFQRLPLSDTFWRSRFYSGREFEYVFEAFKHFKNRQGQWKTIYQHFRNMRKSPGLVNRRRIWDLARTVDDLVRARLESPICSGTRVRSYFESAAAEEEDAVWIEAHRCLRPYNRSFPTGCRELYVRNLLVPRDTINIYVSVVDIMDKTYVSGLRFEGFQGTIQQMGYIRPGNETLLIWNAQTGPCRVTGFHLALDQHGVRGLCIVSGAAELSSWAGQHIDIPKRRLVVPANSHAGIRKLRGGFDALKLVSLSLSTHDSAPERTSLSTAPSLRDTALWFPEIPKPHLMFSGITMENLRLDYNGEHQLPLSMLIFGSYDGAHLNHLDSLKVLAQKNHGVMGIEVTFQSTVDGKTSKVLGTNKPCVPYNGLRAPEELQEYNMSFDVSAGEELVALDVFQGDYVLCLKVHTSLGRAIRFPPPDDSEWDIISRAVDEGELISIKPDSGQIVGFLARAGSKGLQNLGLVHMEYTGNSAIKTRERIPIQLDSLIT